jgi:hypothetical protein
MWDIEPSGSGVVAGAMENANNMSPTIEAGPVAVDRPTTDA